MLVTISKVQSKDRSVICTTEQHVKEFLETLENGDFLGLELRQEVPHKDAKISLLNTAFRIQGSPKASKFKETKTLVCWFSLTKQSFLSLSKQIKGTIGAIILAHTLKETFIPFHELTSQDGLDKEGNVVIAPLEMPNSGEIMLYDKLVPVGQKDPVGKLKLVPMARIVELVEGNYKETKLEERKSLRDNFEGTQKNKNNRKTKEYQTFLNSLYLDCLSIEGEVIEPIQITQKELEDVGI